MKFKDNLIFKLYDLKKNSKFFDKDDKHIYVYDIEEGVTELLELLYDRVFKKRSILDPYEYWSISIDFKDNSYKFENATDALEIFRNKNISDLKSASISFDSCGVYTYTDFVINYDEGVIKKMWRGGHIIDLEVDKNINPEDIVKKWRYGAYLEYLSVDEENEY